MRHVARTSLLVETASASSRGGCATATTIAVTAAMKPSARRLPVSRTRTSPALMVTVSPLGGAAIEISIAPTAVMKR